MGELSIVPMRTDRPAIPCGVAVGRHKKFRCYVSSDYCHLTVTDTATVVFIQCALDSWGWQLGHMKLQRIERVPGGSIWQVERSA